MKRTTITYICDLCSKEFSEQSKIFRHPITVFEIPVDEYGCPHKDKGRVATSQADLCLECIDRIAVIEKYVGMCCPVPDEGKLRWRKVEGGGK